MEADIAFIKERIVDIRVHITRLYELERELECFKHRVYGGTATLLGVGAIVSTVTKVIGVW
jgi:hypothetical protein